VDYKAPSIPALPTVERSSPAVRPIPSLDGLPAVSISTVIVSHLLPRIGFAGQFATFGVQVFLVISGCLITRLLQEQHERNGCIRVPVFYRRRFFRIFPAAYVYIAIIAIASPASRNGLRFAWE
jgi:peptidoglycan/LPS O-acetylase OafA/YrhL